jgi:Bacterial regulatory protein, arsR family
MSNVRAIVIEIDGSDETVRGAIASFFEHFDRKPQPVTPGPVALAIVPAAPKALPAPESPEGRAVMEQDLVSALINLGSKAGDAHRAALRALAETETTDFDAVLKSALAHAANAKPGSRKVQAPASAPDAPAAETEEHLSPCQLKIIARLAKGPRSSADLVTDVGLTGGTVYPALARLREMGRIKTERTDEDPRPLNRLVA